MIHNIIRPFDESFIGTYSNLEEAQKAVDFIQSLIYVEGSSAGQKVQLTRDEKYIVKAIFGTKNKEGYRLYRNVLYHISRKNSKTTFMAWILFYAWVKGGLGVQTYSIANERDQASIVHRIVASIIEAVPQLKKKFKVYHSTKQIKYPKANSFYKSLSTNIKALHGAQALCCLYDEACEYTGGVSGTGRDIYDVMSTSQKALKEPLNLICSTAGYDKTTFYYEEYEYAKKILNGEISNMNYLPIIYELGEDDDWRDETVYYKANPKLGITITLEDLIKERDKALATPSYESNFRRLLLNQWVDSETVWLQMAKWNALADPDFDESQLLGRDCYAGLDLSNRIDLTAFVMIFPLDDGRLYIKPMFFLPEEGLRDKANNDKVPYHMWAKQGYIDLTPDVSIDFRRVEDYVYRCNQMYNILEVGYDRWKSNMLVQNLVDKGVAMVEVSQSFQGLSEAIKEVEVRVLNGNFLHNKNPVMDWNISNCTIIMDDNENVKITKKNKRNKRVDGAVALVMAVKRLMHYESNFYDENYVAPLMYGDEDEED